MLAALRGEAPEALLERDRTPVALAVIEPLLYLRSLEHMPLA